MVCREACYKGEGFWDPFKPVKDEENTKALKLLPGILKGVFDWRIASVFACCQLVFSHAWVNTFSSDFSTVMVQVYSKLIARESRIQTVAAMAGAVHLVAHSLYMLYNTCITIQEAYLSTSSDTVYIEQKLLTNCSRGPCQGCAGLLLS